MLTAILCLIHELGNEAKRRVCRRHKNSTPGLYLLGLLTSKRLSAVLYSLSNLLGLLFGEMVTSLLIILGDCCSGGVLHCLSSASVWEVSSSPTRILSKLPSSIPFPSHLPHGNLKTNKILWSKSFTLKFNSSLKA